MLFLFTRVCYQWLWAEGWKLPQKMWCLSSEFVFWAQNSSFFFWIYPAILSQRPMVTAPTIWMDWRATSWHPHRHSQPISFTFDLRFPPLPGECVAYRLEAAQDPLPISQSSFRAFHLACTSFHSSGSVCQRFSRISQHFKSSSITPPYLPVRLRILFCFLKMFIWSKMWAA